MEPRTRGAKLGVLVQQAREKKGLSTRQLGAAIGTTHSYIHKLEAGFRIGRALHLKSFLDKLKFH